MIDPKVLNAVEAIADLDAGQCVTLYRLLDEGWRTEWDCEMDHAERCGFGPEEAVCAHRHAAALASHIAQAGTG
jgi:hypothetical protein